MTELAIYRVRRSRRAPDETTIVEVAARSEAEAVALVSELPGSECDPSQLRATRIDQQDA